MNKEFKDMTDKLIKAYKTKVKSVENGNVIIAKHTLEEKTKGGIIITESAKALENRRSGFGRVIALARNIKPLNEDGSMTGDMIAEVGDYVMFVHESVYKPSKALLTPLLGVDYPEDMLWITVDKDIISVFEFEVK